MRRFIIIFSMLFLGALSAGAQHYDRGYEAVPSSPFLKKGTWMLGGTLRYTQHVNDKYNFLVINDINSEGYKISANPKFMYMFKDNMGAGLRLSYDRSMLDLASADLSAPVLVSGVYCASDVLLALFSCLSDFALQSVDFLFCRVGCHKPLFLSFKT